MIGREQEREHQGAQREHMAERGVSAGVMRLYRILKLKEDIYIYVYTQDSGFELKFQLRLQV